MEWLKTILPIIGVLIGWLLSESSKLLSDKRQDKRKLKKLLFFLLELRYHFAKELSLELDLDRYLLLMKSKLAKRFGFDINTTDLNIDLHNLTPILQNILKGRTNEKKVDFLIENLDRIIVELAEISPILAYELNDQHNIKERLHKANSYLSEFKSFIEALPFNMTEWINPKMTQLLLNDLDVSIETIARKINRLTCRKAKEKISKMDGKSNDPIEEELIDEYLDKVSENLR